MQPWSFREYVDARSRSVVQQWYEHDASEVARAEFHYRLRVLRVREAQEWERPYVAPLRGKYQGLVEIRFRADSVQYRPIGFFGPSRKVFTILIIATKADFKSACDRALQRRADVKRCPGRFSHDPACLSGIA